MKMTWLGLCFGLSVLLLLASCEKDRLEILDPTTDVDNLEFKKKKPAAKVSLSHHGFYVNGFYEPDDPDLNILGDDLRETELLDWAQFHEFNSISLYTIGKILGTNDVNLIAELMEFVDRAKNDYELDVVFSAGGIKGLNRIKAYCAANENNPDVLPSGIVTEYEFWNDNSDGNPYSLYVFLEMLDTLEYLIDTYNLERSFLYIFKFEDKWWNGIEVGQDDDSSDEGPIGYCPAEVMKTVLTRIKQIGEDRLYISFVHYRPNAYNFPPTTSTYYQRLQRLANMASGEEEQSDLPDPQCSYEAQLDMHLNLVILFNVRYTSSSANIWDYFDVNGGNEDFKNAFLNFEEGFNQSALQNKDRLILQGSQIYRYTEAREARPN